MDDQIFNSQLIMYGMIDDILELIDKLIPDMIKQYKVSENMQNQLIKKGISYRVDILEKILVEYKSKNEMNPEIYGFYEYSINSVRSLIKCKIDNISKKNKISLFVFVYLMVGYFHYFLTKDVEPFRAFKDKIIKNTFKIMEREKLSKGIKNTINCFLNEKWKIKGKEKDEILCMILKEAIKIDFKIN